VRRRTDVSVIIIFIIETRILFASNI